MSTTPHEQRNPYEGDPPRPWVMVRLAASDGSTQELKLIADTGSPYPLVIGHADLAKLAFGFTSNMATNFGMLEGAWFMLAMPEFGLNALQLGFASDDVVAVTKQSQQDFEGLAGLPLLRLMEFGGNASAFWIRQAVTPP